MLPKNLLQSSPDPYKGSDKLALSVAEARQAIGVSNSVFYALINAGEIKSFKIGSRRLVSVRALDEFIARREADPEGY